MMILLAVPLDVVIRYRTGVNRDSIMALPFHINSRLRYAHIGLSEHSTRTDVRRVRDRIPEVRGIGPVALQTIDAWLEGGESK